jgi:DNA repair exonuclease SbcCD ATPase subunit
VKLLHLKAHNVFSIGTIELDLKDRGLLQVTGWSYDDNNGNMAGKSSLARNAISWGLYGRTVDGVKADAVINTAIKNAKHCGVTLHFEGIDGEVYRIYRSRKPNSLMLARKMYDTLGGEIEWCELSKRNEKDTQEYINKLLGRDHKTFIQSDFFGQGRERSFLSLTGSEQRAVIEEILPLNSLEVWKENAKKEYKIAAEDLTNSQDNYRAQGERVCMADSHLHTLQSQSAGWNTNHITDERTLRDRLNKIQLMSSGIEEEITTLKCSLPAGDTQAILDRWTTELHEIIVCLTSLDHKIDSLTGDIDRRATRPDTCASCDQLLPLERIKLNEASLTTDRQTREILIQNRGEQQAKHYNTSANIGICNEVLALEATITTKGEEEGLRMTLQQTQAQTNPFTCLVSSAQENHEDEYKALQTYSKVISIMEERLSHYTFWKDAFGTDIKTMLFEQVCPFLEDKTNEYLRDMNNGQIKVKFSTIREMKSGETKDQFCVTAASDTGSNVFELFSGAEKQLTSFAVGMALSDLAGMQTEGASSFMILDEPFLYQSPENCENLVNFITQKLKKSTILLVSNEDNLSNLVPNRIRVVKREGVSSLE